MKQEIANGLLSIQAVFLRPDQPFTWASGIKSPIYCDNRLTLTAPDIRTLVEESLVKNIKEYFPTCEVVMGTSTAGIPMGYVRGSAKDHGRTNQIEGKLIPGQKVVVIEDLISTAGSSVDTVNILREAGADVLGIASIFTYNMKKATDRLKENSVKNVSLCDLDALLDVAVDKNYIKQDDKSKILKFRDNPQDETWMKGEK